MTKSIYDREYNLAAFKENKYLKIYDDFITTRQAFPSKAPRLELHHIIPASFFLDSPRQSKFAVIPGTGESEDNIVQLSIREHLFAHHLLCRITTGKSKTKMYLSYGLICSQKINRNYRSLRQRVEAKRLMTEGIIERAKESPNNKKVIQAYNLKTKKFFNGTVYEFRKREHVSMNYMLSHKGAKSNDWMLTHDNIIPTYSTKSNTEASRLFHGAKKISLYNLDTEERFDGTNHEFSDKYPEVNIYYILRKPNGQSDGWMKINDDSENSHGVRNRLRK